MKFIKYLFIGILFGIVMTKSEAISWYRMQEMFRFQSIHMYGIIGTALMCGVAITAWLKKSKLNSLEGTSIEFTNKTFTIPRYLLGGTVFGLGWALSGACPGPMYTLLGNGYSVFIVVILSAIFGTFLYGVVRDRLPH